MAEGESERIQRIYRTYMESVRSRWNPENPGNQAIAAERRRRMAALLRRCGLFPGAGSQVLEVGCGSGNILGGLLSWGVPAENLYGIDLLPERIAAAREAYPGIHFAAANAEQMGFQDGMFDLVLVVTVFSSILEEEMRTRVAREIDRVLKPGGAVVWYDFRYNNPANPHVRGVKKRQIQQLFPTCRVRLETLTVLPALARRLGKLTPLLYPLLSWIPFLRTHALGVLAKPKRDAG